MSETSKDNDLLDQLVQRLISMRADSPESGENRIKEINPINPPADYETTKNKASPREFVKNLADKGTERINKELIPQLNIKFDQYDKSIEENNEKLVKVDELSEKLPSIEDAIRELEAASIDLSGSNEWT